MPQKELQEPKGAKTPAFIDSPSWEPYVELSFRDKQESNIWGGKTHGDQKACYTYDCQSLKKFLIGFGLILINDNVNNLPNLQFIIGSGHFPLILNNLHRYPEKRHNYVHYKNVKKVQKDLVSCSGMQRAGLKSSSYQPDSKDHLILLNHRYS